MVCMIVILYDFIICGLLVTVVGNPTSSSDSVFRELMYYVVHYKYSIINFHEL